MKVLLTGTAGPGGWPEPGCRCASCGRVTTPRRPFSVVIDDNIPLTHHDLTRTPDGDSVIAPDGDRLLFANGDRSNTDQPNAHRANTSQANGHRTDGDRANDDRANAANDHGSNAPGTKGPHGRDVLDRTNAPGAERPHLSQGRGGLDRTDAPGAEPYDIVLIDLLERPDHLGDLRRRGLVDEATQIVAVGLDHRAPSEAELERRLRFWGAITVPDGTVLDTKAPQDRVRPRTLPRRTLLLGGSRSGKSAEAELRLAAEPEVTYVATASPGHDDPEWQARLKAHQARRPAHWRTLETTDLTHLLTTETGVLLIDGLGTWLTATIDAHNAWPPAGPEPVHTECANLLKAWRQTTAHIVAVTEEVGQGIVPSTPSGRLFRDLLGTLNQHLTTESEESALITAGRITPLPT
ncbi:bifunctional adenosylcobinamide kinase/adenosylcobinamide-phosphate guanylyltransferase [Acrocarpospora sp. B8E8]|uniref:bifunctional adenosylcobinamide kinase/adenosylcobinamide-phosphate guanylyltransferase n=1 Tax=Acrocarpospora sp. B8E8 TaxID=3153572 RepID=UPI00325E5DC4